MLISTPILARSTPALAIAASAAPVAAWLGIVSASQKRRAVMPLSASRVPGKSPSRDRCAERPRSISAVVTR